MVTAVSNGEMYHVDDDAMHYMKHKIYTHTHIHTHRIYDTTYFNNII